MIPTNACPSAPRDMSLHAFRWSTKVCEWCGADLATVRAPLIRFHADDKPTIAEWDAYCNSAPSSCAPTWLLA